VTGSENAVDYMAQMQTCKLVRIVVYKEGLVRSVEEHSVADVNAMGEYESFF